MKSWCEIVEDDGSITKARLVVMSTKDYMFRNRANYVTDWFGDWESELDPNATRESIAGILILIECNFV